MLQLTMPTETLPQPHCMFGMLKARYLMTFAYYVWTADIVRDVIYQSGFSIRPPVCPSVCLSQQHCVFGVPDRNVRDSVRFHNADRDSA